MTTESSVIFYNCTPHEVALQINQQRVDERLPAVDPLNNYRPTTFQNTQIRRENNASSRELEFATMTELEVQFSRRPGKTYHIKIEPEVIAIEEAIVIYLFMDTIQVMETTQGKVISQGED